MAPSLEAVDTNGEAFSAEEQLLVPCDSGDDRYILVTGGLGYIGSHTTLELLKNGYNVVVIDNLSNSHLVVLERIKLLVGQHFLNHPLDSPILQFHQIDYRDTKALHHVLDQYVLTHPASPWRSKITGIIHFAAYKAVAESIRIPLSYYSNNVAGFVHFLETLSFYNIKTLVFSSSATVYGSVPPDTKSGNLPEELCIHALEETYITANGQKKIVQQGCTGLTNPYGRSKWMCEAILWDLCVSDPDWRVAALRYFNPVGCDPSGLLGEDPLGLPNNLMPVICRVLRCELSHLNVFGNDYETPDGTGVRDFIHVCDLAKGHLAAIRTAAEGELVTPFRTFNLGSGKGYSVLELVEGMKFVSRREIPLLFTERRKGDVARSVARPGRAKVELGWQTERGLIECCRDTWNYVLKNPRGYRTE